MNALLNLWNGETHETQFIKCTNCRTVGHVVYINELTALCGTCLNDAVDILNAALLQAAVKRGGF